MPARSHLARPSLVTRRRFAPRPFARPARLAGTLAAAAVLAGSPPASADVPQYSLEVVANYELTTSLVGASDVGHFAGWQVVAGVVQPFVATPGEGLRLLPLPPGFVSGAALDVNDGGVVVGAVSSNGFPFDTGEPAVWLPDRRGGYRVLIPEQFESLPSPLGTLSIDGGQIVAIGNDGTMVGWSRFQGFQGGPSTRFTLDGPPQDLRTLGFEATVRDINDQRVIVGDQLRLDLDTGVLTELGVPDPLPGNQSFTNAIAFRVNNAGEAVVAANLAGIPTENWLTYIHNDEDGYIRLNESQLPSLNVGFYDNNDLGDVSASGGVLFRAEDVLLPGYDSLLDEASSDWSTAIGFIAQDRSVSTVAVNDVTGASALVRLVPAGVPSCPADVDEDGVVDFADLVLVLAAFGGDDAAADVDASGVVDFADLVLVLAAFGSEGCE